MSVGDLALDPEFLRTEADVYLVRGIADDGNTYYESYHFEQIKEYFAVEHVLHRGEFPERIPGGYDAFRRAFERDIVRKGRHDLSFATICYDGAKPVDVAIPPNTRSPTVKEVLGPDADLRNHWERSETRKMTKEEDNALRQMAIRIMNRDERAEAKRKEAHRAQEKKRQRKGFAVPEGNERRIAGTGKKFPSHYHRRSASPESCNQSGRNSHRSPSPSPTRSYRDSEYGEPGPSTLPSTNTNGDVRMGDEESSPSGISIRGQAAKAAKGNKKGKGRSD